MSATAARVSVFILARALTYATLFIGLVLVYVPSELAASVGARPSDSAVARWAGLVLSALGGAVALWCVLAFAVLGKGTPLPLDPPRRLVVRGPYRFVRNPMYLGAVTALAGAALHFESLALAGYAAGFLLLMHAFVVWYEEPTLKEMFGPDYDRYRAAVRRWRPGLRAPAPEER
jgi:protein-S-isoprenylcysteine O-methyltransferase Ste14